MQNTVQSLVYYMIDEVFFCRQPVNLYKSIKSTYDDYYRLYKKTVLFVFNLSRLAA